MKCEERCSRDSACIVFQKAQVDSFETFVTTGRCGLLACLLGLVVGTGCCRSQVKSTVRSLRCQLPRAAGMDASHHPHDAETTRPKKKIWREAIRLSSTTAITGRREKTIHLENRTTAAPCEWHGYPFPVFGVSPEGSGADRKRQDAVYRKPRPRWQIVWEHASDPDPRRHGSVSAVARSILYCPK